MNTHGQEQLLQQLATAAGAKVSSQVICEQVIHKKTNEPYPYLYHYKVPNPVTRKVFAFASVRPDKRYPEVGIMENSLGSVNFALMPRLRRVYGRDFPGYSWVGKPHKVNDGIYLELVYALSIAAHACIRSPLKKPNKPRGQKNAAKVANKP